MNAIKDGKHIRIFDAFPIRESLKEIPGRYYDPNDKAWVIPVTDSNVSTLLLLGVDLEPALRPQPEQDAPAGNETPLFPMPIKAKPYQHQVRAYNFALRTFGIGGST